MAVEPSFYSTFKDSVSSAAKGRGADRPEWADVLLVATNIGETAEILREQSISTAGLRRDIAFTQHFGAPEPIRPVDPQMFISQSLRTQALTQLRHDITQFAQTQDLIATPKNGQVAQTLVGFLTTYLEDQAKLTTDPRFQQLLAHQRVILAQSIEGFATQFTPVFPPNPQAPKAEAQKVISANKAFMAQVMGQFSEFVQAKNKPISTDDHPLVVLGMESDGQVQPISDNISPFQIVDTTLRTVDPFLTYLLHRNGLMVPDDYEPLFKMPHPTVINHGLEALTYAREIREKTVRPAHLLPSLLSDSNVLWVIRKLDGEGTSSDSDDYSFMWGGGFRQRGRDLIKFNEAVRDALKPKADGERFRYRVQTTPEIREFLKVAEGVVLDGDEYFAEARVLYALTQNNAEAREVLLSAGLTEEQLQKWPETIDELAKKRLEAGKGKKDDEEEVDFKISDHELKALLETYGTDLTKLATEGKIEPIIGREKEIAQMMRILLQRDRSNPLLLGEPGVGKTALFEGLARRVAAGQAPDALIGARVIKIDLSGMNAGAMWRGQFEGRLLPIIKGIAERNAKGDKPPIILCIDELHAALQAGRASGTPDAAQLLKPYLTKGELFVIGATTQDDYAKYIEVDSALDRRFQSIFIGEPNFADTLEIMKGLKEQYASHHKVEIDNALLEAIVKLSGRYLPNQNQPDKAIRILDSVCAKVKMHSKTVVEIGDIVETIAAEAKIDPEFLKLGEEERFLDLKDKLPQQVLGQREATEAVANALITAKADLQDPKKPLGVFLFLGPTGVGKTETGRALSRLLHGSEANMIRIDMSDYKEHHEASKLFGAPPGFVGYGEEGLLTGAVRRQPYSVVVLDEIEKADPEVLKRLLPIFEEGEIVDGRGQRVSFRNTIILMTSNLGAQAAVGEAESQGLDPQDDNQEWRKVTRQIYNAVLKKQMLPEFLNRIDKVVTYQPLTQDVVDELVTVEINTLSKRVADRYGVTLKLGEGVGKTLGNLGYSPEYGARELKRVITQNITQPLAQYLLGRNGEVKKGDVLEITAIGENFNIQ